MGAMLLSVMLVTGRSKVDRCGDLRLGVILDELLMGVWYRLFSEL